MQGAVAEGRSRFEDGKDAIQAPTDEPPSSPTAAGGIARTVCGKGVDMGPTRRLSKFCVCDTLEVVGGELVIANCQRPL